jgi:hypothetical protein
MANNSVVTEAGLQKEGRSQEIEKPQEFEECSNPVE